MNKAPINFNLNKVLQEESFIDYLTSLVHKRGKSFPELYKKALVDKRRFSNIKCQRSKPGKRTVFAFAIALELDMTETKELLSRNGQAIAPNDILDQFVAACIESKFYNINDINIYLDELNQLPIGLAKVSPKNTEDENE